jgi:hypothetical protein
MRTTSESDPHGELVGSPWGLFLRRAKTMSIPEWDRKTCTPTPAVSRWAIWHDPSSIPPYNCGDAASDILMDTAQDLFLDLMMRSLTDWRYDGFALTNSPHWVASRRSQHFSGNRPA